MFDKLNEFLEEHDFNWTKCKSVTTDGATPMQGSTNTPIHGVVIKIKRVSQNCVSNHCRIHREALVVKKLNHDKNQRSELEIVLINNINVVNISRSHSKNHRMFSELCKDMVANALSCYIMLKYAGYQE